jgi:hypothetical protein
MIYGSECLIKDFTDLGYQPELVIGIDGQTYAVFKEFEVPIGRFSGKIIDLAIMVPPDYPRMVHSSIHVKTNPQLLEKTDTIPGVRNIIDSGLGTEWRYWSFAFKAESEDTAKHLMSQIAGVFKRA